MMPSLSLSAHGVVASQKVACAFAAFSSSLSALKGHFRRRNLIAKGHVNGLSVFANGDYM